MSAVSYVQEIQSYYEFEVSILTFNNYKFIKKELGDNFKIVDKYSYPNDISYFLFIIQFHVLFQINFARSNLVLHQSE